MDKFDYKSEVESFANDLKMYNCLLMPKEDDEIGICKELSQSKSNKYKGILLSNSDIQNLFLRNIRCLGPKTKNFYERKVPKIKIVKCNNLKNGEANIAGFFRTEQIYITDRPLKDVDLFAYFHELGHVPTFEKSNYKSKEFYEYLEAFPIFLEALAMKNISNDYALELFKRIRTEISKNEASIYLQANWKMKNNGSYKDKFLETVKRECYQYIKSYEYALQLMERWQTDRNMVNNELDRYILGEVSLKDLRKELDIDTTGCKKIKQITRK